MSQRYRFNPVEHAIVVGTFSFMWLVVRASGEGDMHSNNGFDLCQHFFDLCVCEDLNAEVIFLKFMVHNLVAVAVNMRDNILIHNLIA